MNFAAFDLWTAILIALVVVNGLLLVLVGRLLLVRTKPPVYEDKEEEIILRALDELKE